MNGTSFCEKYVFKKKKKSRHQRGLKSKWIFATSELKKTVVLEHFTFNVSEIWMDSIMDITILFFVSKKIGTFYMDRIVRDKKLLIVNFSFAVFS